MAEPREIAEQILDMSGPARLSKLTKILEMVQAAIVIRSACRDKYFLSMSGGEDSGTRFDRLLKELFGMVWKEPEPKKKARRKSVISRPLSQGKRRSKKWPLACLLEIQR